jgi:tRNA(Arg) A34 adenosine deaminase TadA
MTISTEELKLIYAMSCHHFSLQMPKWYESFLESYDLDSLNNDSKKLAFAVELSAQNIKHQSGGPFGAAIFCHKTHKLISAGVNLVTTQNTSLAHAECVSIALAQQSSGTYDLMAAHSGTHTLYCSAQPCIMCFGAIWWSGVTRVVCAATSHDVENLTGFVEGPVPHDWELQLKNRTPLPSVEVVWGSKELRQSACQVLSDYKSSGGKIYNAGQLH